jgi:dihydrolipoamide dehydrogenase
MRRSTAWSCVRALAMEFGASSEDLARTCHRYPTLEEAIKEVAFEAHGSPIHI